MYVMAGLLIDTSGRVLLAERPAGKHLAGFWEFPGGKLESGEQPVAALARELHEELGIELRSATPLIRIPWTYGDLALVLDAWVIDTWLGTPQSLEGQALQWCDPATIDPLRMTPADRPILHALRLPKTYAVTPAGTTEDQREHVFQRTLRAISGGARLLQLQLPLWTRESVRALAAELLPTAGSQGAQLLLHGDIDGARLLGIGVHLTRDQLLTAVERPLPWHQLVGVSCLDEVQLAMATAMGADFATLSPGYTAASPVGDQMPHWLNFQVQAEAAALPVYASNSADQSLPAEAIKFGAQGVVIDLPD